MTRDENIKICNDYIAALEDIARAQYKAAIIQRTMVFDQNRIPSMENDLRHTIDRIDSMRDAMKAELEMPAPEYGKALEHADAMSFKELRAAFDASYPKYVTFKDLEGHALKAYTDEMVSKLSDALGSLSKEIAK